MAKKKTHDRLWIKGLGFILFSCCLSLSYLVWRLPPKSSHHWQEGRPAARVTRPSLAAPAVQLTVGAAPTLGDVSFGGRRLQSRRLELELMAVESGNEFLPCQVVRASSNRGQLDCAGAPADLQVTPFHMTSGPGGFALRWHVTFQSPVKKLRVSAWLPGAMVEGHVDGSPVAARHRPSIARLPSSCSASSSFPGRGPERLLDDDRETEWFAAKGEKDSAWIMLDLEGDRVISSVSWVWWAKSMADEWTLESRADDEEAWTMRSSHESEAPSEVSFNAEVSVKGWKAPCRYLRLTMRKGHLDPWNFGVHFGLRSFVVLGTDDAATAGAEEAWHHGSAQPAGLWLALEHPRSHCHVDQKRVKAAGELQRWRWVTCTLQLSEKPMGKSHVFASLGMFEDGQQSQMRRSFGEYLQLARGRPFGQVLHYNSWYDLRNPSCQTNQANCFSHPMTAGTVLERLQAFNGNLTRFGGHALDAFLLDDGWDNADSLWEVDRKHFSDGFEPLVATAKNWGTRMGVWMSPFGGYGAAGGRRTHFGALHGFERSSRGGFALAGPKYFANFFSVVRSRISEGFGLFKFDGLGGGLGQSGGEEHLDDFEAMLHLIEELRGSEELQVWISLTIGTWPSPFWLLWADSIWRDGPDVGFEGTGSLRDRWLTFRDQALQRAQARGPLFPATAFMQHGVVWSKTAETMDMWSSGQPPSLQDFCNEVLSFFFAGTGLQELYIQKELMDDDKWKVLAAASQLARQDIELLQDARLVAFGGLYGVAALRMKPAGRAVFWLRNPSEKTQEATFTMAELLELPDTWQNSRWTLSPLLLDGCPEPVPKVQKSDLSSLEKVTLPQPAFAVRAWTADRIL